MDLINKSAKDDDDTSSDLSGSFKQPMSERIYNLRYPDGNRHADNPYINTSSKIETLKNLRQNAES